MESEPTFRKYSKNIYTFHNCLHLSKFLRLLKITFSHSRYITGNVAKRIGKNINICGFYGMESEPTFHWFYCNKRHLKKILILILILTTNTNHKYWDLMKSDHFKVLIKTVSLHIFEQINPLTPST